MSEPQDSLSEQAEDLPAEVTKRKTWFYECQVRHLNIDSFRSVSEAFSDARLDLIAEPLVSDGQPGQRPQVLGNVYLDSKEAVWTPDENLRRDAFAAKFIGRVNNWIGYQAGTLLAGRLKELKALYEANLSGMQSDMAPGLATFGRKAPREDENSMGRAISRVMLAEMKPWLIPELYFSDEKDRGFAAIDQWVGNLEAFVKNYESELVISTGGMLETPIPGDPRDGSVYQDWLKLLIEASATRDTADSLKSKMLNQVKDPVSKEMVYQYEISIGTTGGDMKPVDQFPHSEGVKYWTRVVKSSLGECYVNKQNADMGLCTILRTIYLLGAMPSTLGSVEDFQWRKKAFPAADFDKFFSQKAADEKLKTDGALRERFDIARAKMRTILEETAAHPRSASPAFSPLTQEIVRQALHQFKFWLDEPFRVSTNDALIKARKDTRIETNDKHMKQEMEYWSENHYIMFASSEFLAGQLWEKDAFQPGKQWLKQSDKTGIMDGKRRMERGRARVLKWLNNRLMFGWTEFNSSGYYREHLWALLNLADFSLDREVREKAAMAVDLLLFDVVRYHHKGAIGAAGGRSQFKSKASGWDNALGDVVETMLGSRSIFSDGDSQIGVGFATSRYKPPEVLLEIGTHPPATPVTDRSRVSITFEEAPKYGIGYSKKSDQKDSVMQGYAPKRARHFPFLDAVNKEIARTHKDYGAAEDDIVFWWGCSAYYNKQVVSGTFRMVKTFGLGESTIFSGAVPTLIEVVSGYEKVKHGLVGAAVGSFLGPVGAVVGGAVGFFEDDVLESSLVEPASDDLSVLIEGSTRTRANILTYKTPDVMLSSIQNWRPGQLNFQSSVNLATLNAGVSVFTTAGLEDIDISDLLTTVGGAAAGGLIGMGIGLGLTFLTGGAVAPIAPSFAAIGATAGAAGGLIGNEVWLTREELLVEHEDGPGWWTGSWALPMVVQHDSAAILIYQFHEIHHVLADCGCHAWFPKAGIKGVQERRTSAYDNADFFLLDTFDIGPKGFWLFGKTVHPADETGRRGEAYIGVFSNQRPEWLDQDSDFYEEQLKKVGPKTIKKKKSDIKNKLDDDIEDKQGESAAKAVGKAVDQAVDGAFRANINRDLWLNGAKEALKHNPDTRVQAHLGTANEIAELKIDKKIAERIWKEPLPRDYFEGRDWYVDSKNIWILQVGSAAEFGSYETFKDRVSRARIHLDDTGDMECSYDIPRAGNTSQRLSISYGDGGRFGLDGHGFQTDHYPRFENPYVRSGRVEWGQREYVIEYRGKQLLHDFSDFMNPIRTEEMKAYKDARHTVKALVIFLRTGDEEMDDFTVARADVTIGCATATRDQIIAAGPVDEDSDHDAEWIFFDSALLRSPDMTITINHPASSDGDDDPHWKMSFTMKALMGDRTLRPCSLSSSSFEFEDERRTTPRYPFSIVVHEWRPWEAIPDHKSPTFWMIARQPDFTKAYFDYVDLLVVDPAGRLWHRRLISCAANEKAWSAVTQGRRVGTDEPDLSKTFFAAAVSARPHTLFLAIQSQGALFASQPSPSDAWTEGWKHVDVWIYPDLIFGVPNTSGAPIPVPLSASSTVAGMPSSSPFGGVELFVLAADGHFYSRTTQQPADPGPWQRIDVSGFTALFGAEFVVTGAFLLALASDRSLWAAVVDHSDNHASPAWERLTPDDFSVSRFTATNLQGGCQIVASTTSGNIRAATYRPGRPLSWAKIDLPNVLVMPGSPLASAAPAADQAKFFAIGADGKVYSIDWDSKADWTAEKAWLEVAADGQGIESRLGGGIAAVSRVSGQVEVIAQNKEDALLKAWWS
jgi:hypothetical protein